MGARARFSKLAVCGLISGILSLTVFVLIPVTMVIGLAALYRIRRSTGALKGLLIAFTGIVLSFAALAFACLVMADGHVRYCSFRVPTASMSPAIKAKERIVVDVAAYKARSPARGDVIVYELLDNGKRRMMCKRIVGLPGEEAEIRGGKIYINGAPADVPGLAKDIVYLNGGNFGKDGQALKVPDGFYYVLGDNPAASFDSRQHGVIDGRDIKGKYVFKYNWFLK